MKFLLRRLPYKFFGMRIFTWLIVFELLKNLQDHLKVNLSGDERKRARKLIWRSYLRSSTLSAAEKAEAAALLQKIDVKTLAGRLTKTAVGLRTKKKGFGK